MKCWYEMARQMIKKGAKWNFLDIFQFSVKIEIKIYLKVWYFQKNMHGFFTQMHGNNLINFLQINRWVQISNFSIFFQSDVLPLPLSSIPSPQPSPSTSEVLTKSESDSVYYRRASFVPVQITSNPMNRGSSDASLKSAPPHVPHVASCPLMEEEILQHDNGQSGEK